MNSIGKIQCHIWSNHFVGYESSRLNGYHKLRKVVLTDDIQYTLIHFIESIINYFFLKFTCLKITTCKKLNQIGKFGSFQFMHKSYTYHIVTSWIIYRFLVVCKPWKLLQIWGRCEIFIVVFYVLIICRNNSQMTEIINDLTECITSMLFICRHFWHNKISLTQRSPLWVNADKYISNYIYVKFFRKLYNADLSCFYAF